MSMHFFQAQGTDEHSVRMPKGYRATVRWVPQLGDIFPDFTANTTQGKIRFHDWAEGKWTCFFSLPAAFSPVCSTEMASFANAQDDFDRRGVRLLGLSRDRVQDQCKWLSDVERVFDGMVTIPVIEDPEGMLASAFGMTHPKQGVDWTIRKSFIIDPELKVRTMFEYPVGVGRSSVETLRVIDALQMQDETQLGTPADWQPGEACVLPHGMSDAEADGRYGTGWQKLTEYLKVVRPAAG